MVHQINQIRMICTYAFEGAVRIELAPFTRGVARPIVWFKQSRNTVLMFVGSAVSGVPSGAKMAVLLYETRARATLLAR